MKKLMIDLGIQEYEVAPGKILRFNPEDINLYDRIFRAMDEILQVEQELVEKAAKGGAEVSGEVVIRLLAEADSKMKKILNRVFGGSNDFEDIFDGVNLMAVGSNGERIITNFLAAITPIVEEGARKAAKDMARQDAARIQHKLRPQGTKK